ncbi:MAG: exodeoxyribonuclease III [Planctomycetes bacterium]|nr:exodeoxyribonuclease III [Planctomycetota bacterium]
MRIATFNCNSIRVRLSAVLAWLDKHSPDILALQETKCVDQDFPAGEFTERGWHIAYRGEKSYNGVAVVTKSKPEQTSFGLGDDAGESATRLVHIRTGEIDLINTYIPQGQSLDSDKFKFKLEWLARLRRYFDKNFRDANNARLAWVGDLNVAPTSIDVYDSRAVWPHVCHCEQVIDAFLAVHSFGFIDVFRKHLPAAGIYTFWDYRQKGALERNRGWRIDHILASPLLASRSSACAVDIEPRQADRPSDHTFVYADFV